MQAGDSEVLAVVRALRELPLPFDRREDLRQALLDRGFSASLAAWMTTNLRHGEGGLVWRFDLDPVEALLLDYAQVDLWPWLDSPERHTPVELLRAERSDRWTPELLARLASPPPLLRLHTLADAGHWVHVDQPQALRALLRGCTFGGTAG